MINDTDFVSAQALREIAEEAAKPLTILKGYLPQMLRYINGAAEYSQKYYRFTSGDYPSLFPGDASVSKYFDSLGYKVSWGGTNVYDYLELRWD